MGGLGIGRGFLIVYIMRVPVYLSVQCRDIVIV